MNTTKWEQEVEKNLKEKGIFYMRVKITPSAGKTEISEILEGEERTVKILVKAPAEKGKANSALCKFLEKKFECECEVASGHTERIKLIKLWKA